MKDPVLAVITALKANTAIAAIVIARVYRTSSVPADPTPPYIVVSRISAKRLNLTHNRTRVGQTRIQCSAFASTDLVADNLSELIADSLNMIDNTYMAPGVFVIRIDDQGTVPDSDASIPIYTYHRDFLINYNV
jgi:hypothetical protein